jgi:hypothetical protein
LLLLLLLQILGFGQCLWLLLLLLLLLQICCFSRKLWLLLWHLLLLLAERCSAEHCC